MPVGFGIVGCGMIAKFHARAIGDLRGATLVGACDRDPSFAQQYASQQRCTPYASLEEMLADPKIDIVTICTPSGAHMEPALAAIRAGKHVIVEKPLEITLQRCDKIIEAAEKQNVIVSTIFPSRFHESSQLIKKAVDARRFGKLTLGDAIVKWYRPQSYYDSGAWRGTWELDGGGALMNQAIHSVDLLLWLMGPIKSVMARAATLAHQRIVVEDVVVANVEFENGALGVIEASTAVYPGYLKRIEIHGSDGSAILEEESIKAWEFSKPARADSAVRQRMAGKTKTGGGAADPSAIGHHGHTAQFRDVLQAIRSGRSPLIDAREGRRSVEVILAIYKSAESGRPVELPLRRDPVWKNRRRSRTVEQ